MSSELIVFTHNDLDALGCMLNIEYKWPSVKKKYFHTNYANIEKIASDIIDYKSKNGNTHILITDVSFSDNKDQLARLYKEFNYCTCIDHHMYPDGFWDAFPNMKVVWDKSKSATLLCNEYLGNIGKNKNLDKLTNIIDVYDLWQYKSEYFEVSQDINEYFWNFGIDHLLQEIIDNGYKLPKNYLDIINGIKKEATNAISKYEESNLIHRAGEISIAFIDEWINQVVISEMKQGKNFVVIANSYGVIRIRVNQESGYTEDQLNKLRYLLTGNAEYGHLHAFTYKIKTRISFENIMNEVKRIVDAIEESTL